jgi:hypothetical protein
MEGVLLMWPCAEEMGGGGKRGRGRGGRCLLKRRQGEVGEGGQVARMPCGGMGWGRASAWPWCARARGRCQDKGRRGSLMGGPCYSGGGAVESRMLTRGPHSTVRWRLNLIRKTNFHSG